MYQVVERKKNGSPQYFQTSLKIGQPGDKYEQEADAVADKVMMMPERSALRMQPVDEEEEEKLQMNPFPSVKENIQMKCKECEEEEMLQTKPVGDSGFVSHDISGHLESSNGRGSFLSGNSNQFMSKAFGRDFSGVKVHTDQNAVQMNQQLGARAFTYGNNIFFNSGEYNPETTHGKRLLAHELTHTIQQGNNLISPEIQCDFAVEPTTPERAVAVLTPAQVQSAIRFNNIIFNDIDEISEIRDILGLSREPAVVDEDFVQGVVDYQAQYGLRQDGKLGGATAGILYNEVKAEADYLEQPETGTPLRRVERRLYLRSIVPGRSGEIAHQGFIGDNDRPRGIVTVRINANESALNAAADRAISLDYTGEDANQVSWLQFINRSFYGFQPGSDVRIYNNGNITTTGGTYAYSSPGAITWNLDTASAASPFYESGGLSVQTPNRSLVMIDQPGGPTVAMQNAFATSQVPNLDRLVMRATFDTYAVKNNRVFYRVRWYATYRYNLTTGAASTVIYSLGTTESRSTLNATQRAVLRGRFAANTIP